MLRLSKYPKQLQEDLLMVHQEDLLMDHQGLFGLVGGQKLIVEVQSSIVIGGNPTMFKLCAASLLL